MNLTILELSAGSPNALTVPRQIREYINERGQGRSFNLESFSAHHIDHPHQVVLDFRIIPAGAEQLEPFTVRLVLGGPAARQLADGLHAAIEKDERG